MISCVFVQNAPSNKELVHLYKKHLRRLCYSINRRKVTKYPDRKNIIIIKHICVKSFRRQS